MVVVMMRGEGGGGADEGGHILKCEYFTFYISNIGQGWVLGTGPILHPPAREEGGGREGGRCNLPLVQFDQNTDRGPEPCLAAATWHLIRIIN